MSKPDLPKSVLLKRSMHIVLVGCAVALLFFASSTCWNYFGVQNQAKLRTVKQNIHTLQLMAESYATERGGFYGKRVGELLVYTPQGASSSLDGITLIDLPFASETDINKCRKNGRLLKEMFHGKLPKGPWVGYWGNGTTYAVIGSDENGNLLGGPNNGILILSNQ